MTKTLTEKYNRIVYEIYGVKFRVKTQTDFDKVRTIALLSEVLDKNEMKKFFELILDEYRPVNPVLRPYTDELYDTLQHQMHGYFSFYEQEMWDLWYMYTYSQVMNEVYNKDIPYYDTTFTNTTDRALKQLLTAISNKVIDVIRSEMKILEDLVKKKPPVKVVDGKKHIMHITFIWKTREDEKVCKICNGLDGQILFAIPQVMPHPNCRCDFIIYEWWTDPDGNIVADRSYEVEQNKQAKGDGFAVRQAKVTSKLEGGVQITLFEVEEDGKTKKKTYREEVDE